MIGLDAVYGLAGLLFAGFAVYSAADRGAGRRLTSSAFFALIAASFLFGDRLGDLGNGVLVLLLVGLVMFRNPAAPPKREGEPFPLADGGGAGVGVSTPGVQDLAREGRPSDLFRKRASRTHIPALPPSRGKGSYLQSPGLAGDRLFALALVVPVVALVGALILKRLAIGGVALVDPKQATVVALALGVLAALAVALPVLRARPSEPLQAGAALARSVGWAAILPQMLAALGAVFALAGVGHAVADLAGRWLPTDNELAVVAAYTVGMAVFTMVMGNAFAAFPVMTAGIGLPLIVHKLHGNPAVMGSLGMLSGFCGTLLTPMAANFNIVPVALLELPDRWAVIRVQAPTALVLLAVNTGLMYALVFRF